MSNKTDRDRDRLESLQRVFDFLLAHEDKGDLVTADEGLGEPVEAGLGIEFAADGRVTLLLSHKKSYDHGEGYLQHPHALTNHQAQGSEFDCVVIALEKSKVLDRSRRYTACYTSTAENRPGWQQWIDSARD